MSPYVATRPAGIRRSVCSTRRMNAVGSGEGATVIDVRYFRRPQ
jgi:hypothetical protein